jgi:tetratricopeptide (TPR) repeat protein
MSLVASWFLLAIACSVQSELDRGRAALDQHRLSEAERHFRSVLQREPDRTEALAGLGWAYQLAGERTAARGAFTRCAQSDPLAVECIRGMASVSVTEGNVAYAGDLLARAARLAPGDARVEASLALLDLARGQIEAAGERYQALVEAHPERAEFWLGLAEVRLRQKQVDEALEMVTRGLTAEEVPIRHRAMLLQLRARALAAATAGRENPADCAGSVPPIMTWLDAADGALQESVATGVGLPDLVTVQRLILRRRSMVEDVCPGVHLPRDSKEEIPQQ